MTNSSPSSNEKAANDRLGSSLLGPVVWVESTGSTNEDMVAAVPSGGAHGMVLVADEQTAGRGRRGRSWASVPGSSLLVSVLLRPSEVSLAPSWLVSAAGLALASALQEFGVDARVKWPNDVVVPASGTNKKLAGVLAESVASDGQIDAVVVGLGCNVSAGIERKVELSTSVETEVGEKIDRVDLLVAMLLRLERELENPAGIVERYRNQSATIGQQVRVIRANDELTGLAVDVDSDGHLLLQTDAGREVVSVGDVVHLRPVDPTGGAY